MSDVSHISTGRVDETAGTSRFYDQRGSDYFSQTIDIDMSAIYRRFLIYLKPGAAILDAGSGSGRDTRAFLSRGYDVEAFDASRTLAALSSQFTGVQTQVLRFQEFRSSKQYDGVWCCAALLHVPRSALEDAMSRLFAALKPGGVMYASFKLGDAERVANDGRRFTDIDADDLTRMIGRITPSVKIAELWQTSGESGSQSGSAWLNVIFQRTD